MWWGFGVKAAGSSLPRWPRLLIFCVLIDNQHQHGTLFSHPSNFLFTRTPFTHDVAPANVLSLSNSIPISEVYSPRLFFSFSCFSAVPDRHAGRVPWLTARQAEETRHSSSYQRVRGLSPSCLPPLPLPSLLHHPPPSLGPVLSSQWAGSLTIPQIIHRPSKTWKRQKLYWKTLVKQPVLHRKGVWHASSLFLSEV